MFFLRKIFAAMLLPAALCAVPMALGLVLVLFSRRKSLGKICLTAGVLLFMLVSQNAVGNALLGPLESKFPALLDPLAAVSRLPGRGRPPWIVVLGGGNNSDPTLSVTSRLSSSTLPRLIEGIRLQRILPDTRLILSGGSPYGGDSEGKGMRDLAIALGVEEKKLVVEDRSRNTRDQAVYIKKIVGNDSFILVTSASHMLRAVKMFHKEKLNPIPAPAGHLVVSKIDTYSISEFIPSADAMVKSRKSLYEYLGLAWAKLRGHID
ncbi:ElyC/SanA/YdcF family protein [Nitrospinota bacterium]